MVRANTELKSSPTWSPSPLTRIHVQALGACQIQIGSDRLSPSSETLFGLIMRLIYAPGRQLSRDVLLSAFWPGQPEPRQRGNLRQALYKVRRMNVLMEFDGDTVRLDGRQIVPTFSIDRTIENFERDVLQEHEPFGVFLPGFEPRSEELKEWLHDTREVVHADVRRVLVELLRARRERADWRGAETLSRWLLQFDPLNEEGTLALAECTALNGSKVQAVEMIDRYLEELGPDAGDIRIPATTLRRRLVDPGPRRLSFAPTERHFVGRQEELSDLTLALRRTRWHDGSAYLIHGPPGMGKTRLTLEMSKVAAVEGVLQLRFSCRESDSTRPLSLALELVTDVLGAPGALGCAPESLKHLRRLVGEEPVALADDGTPLPREPLPSPAAIRRAIVDVVAAVGEEKPIFLVVDDVHWLDRQSWDMLVDLIERTANTRLCVVLTSRQPHACGLRPERVPERLRVRELGRLSEEEAVELVGKVAAEWTSQPSPAGLDLIVAQSDRIPLMLHAIACHWAEGGRSDEIPTTLAEFIDRRIDQLGTLGLRAIQLSTLSRTAIPIGFVRDALDLSIPVFTDLLDDLARHGVAVSQAGNIECHDFVAKAAMSRLTVPSERYLRLRLADCWSEKANREGDSEARIEAVEQLLAIGDAVRAFPIVVSVCSELLRTGGAYRALSLLDLARATSLAHPDISTIDTLRRQALFSVGRYIDLLKLVDSDWIHSSAGNEWDVAHPDEALQLLCSANYADATPPQDVIARSIMLAESPALEPWHRLEAARLAIEAAGDIPLPDLARRAYEAAANVRVDNLQLELLRLRIDMYYHTPFGSSETARSAALELLGRISEFEKAELRVFIKQHIGIALRIAGDVRKSLVIFAEVAHESRVLGMNGLARRALCRLVLLNEELGGDVEQSWQWVEETEVMPRSGDTSEIQFYLTKARLLAGRGQAQEARVLHEAAMSTNPFVNEPKPLAYRWAVLLHIVRSSGDNEELRRILPSATAAFRLAIHSGGQDYAVEQIIRAMTVLDLAADEMQQIVDSYLPTRLERSPLAAYLRIAIHECMPTHNLAR